MNMLKRIKKMAVVLLAVGSINVHADFFSDIGGTIEVYYTYVGARMYEAIDPEAYETLPPNIAKATEDTFEWIF